MSHQELHPYLAKAIRAYQTFADTNCPMDAKEFSAYHSACKMALLHISVLDKLLSDTETKQTPEDDLFALLDQAKQELKNENDFP